MDSSKLIELLTLFGQNRNQETYTNVINALNGGGHLLFLPTASDRTASGSWKTLEGGSKLKLTSVFNLNGKVVLAAFSSELTLFSWAQDNLHFTAMDSKDALILCQSNGIDKIVIDSDQATMFVLELNR
ncbi:MAG: SseB family protein [Bacteroidota bacterium]|nr:SseB family protein [Bacteroidota bacterium]